ncbi:hypothetical protein [Nocardia gamkensis]|uniref:Uncharacterized protein n=1 Tax=Nocardia gamkensis TaxID=352869 RepID=A0A7X6R503_9NOCA|nr:hypothetical protein [Nocardia gamkensis]NKY28882.1 hypothetical protein [Nocardia gamkensis]NQE68172.1 hypothetical protein [Nocardia gamkensis]
MVQTEIDALLATDPDARRAQLRLLRSAFVPALATINPDNDQPMRRIASWAELPAESQPLIDTFVNKRLLVKDHPDGRVVVEVALESLLRLRRRGRHATAAGYDHRRADRCALERRW